MKEHQNLKPSEVLIVYVLLIVICETFAMSSFKKSRTKPAYFLIGIAMYIAVGFLLYKAFAIKGLAIVNALWSALSVLATTLVGVLYFKEVLHSHDYIAIFLISCGIFILKITD